MKQRLAVFGSPILHSLSPTIFQEFFRCQNMTGDYLRINEDDASKVIAIFKNWNLRAASLTAPLKQQILPLLEDYSFEARQIEAVNLIRLKDGKIRGENTDWIGVKRSIEQCLKENIIAKPDEALVIGAGGAARASVYALKNMQITPVVINRTTARAQALAKTHKVDILPWEKLKEAFDKYRLIISTLPDSTILSEKINFGADHIFFDANYKTGNRLLKKQPLKPILINGQRWLWEQALSAFEMIFNQVPNCPDESYLQHKDIVTRLEHGSLDIDGDDPKLLDEIHLQIDPLIKGTQTQLEFKKLRIARVWIGKLGDDTPENFDLYIDSRDKDITTISRMILTEFH